MKRFCSILLITFLFSCAGFPVFTQENSHRFVKEESQKETKIKLVENRITIENLPKDDLLEIFNIMGVKVYSKKIKAGTNEYTLNLTKGYYIIKIGKLTRKVAIK